MRLNEPLGIEIVGEGSPNIKYPGDPLWSGISLPMMSYGYEIQLTPLQILTFYNAVANNGKMVKPKFVKYIKDKNRIVKTNATEILNPSICSQSTIKKVKKMLEGVVENGTGKNLSNTNFKIAGKTGTAQIANKKDGYKFDSEVSYQASFVGYFPADNPKYSCIVVINSPSREINYYGNLVAGPVFKEIADKVYSTSLDIQEDLTVNYNDKNIQIPYTKNGYKPELNTVLKNLSIESNSSNTNSDWVITKKLDTCIEFNNRIIRKNLVPNVLQMGIKDAIYLLENAGLKVVFKGRGSVKKQSIPPGTKIKQGDRIILEMSFST